MQVNFTPTPDDLAARQLHESRQGASLRQKRTIAGRIDSWSSWAVWNFSVVAVLLLAMVSAAKVVGNTVREWGWDRDWYVFSFYLTAGLTLFIGVFVMRWYSKKMTAVLTGRWIRKRISDQQRKGELARELAPRQFEITPDELVVTTEPGADAVHWSSVVSIARTAEHAFFYRVNRPHPDVVPNRAFASEDEFRVFLGTARAYQQDAPAPGAESADESPSGVRIEPGGVMTLTYRLTPDDLVAQRVHNLLHGNSLRMGQTTEGRIFGWVGRNFFILLGAGLALAAACVGLLAVVAPLKLRWLDDWVMEGVGLVLVCVFFGFQGWLLFKWAEWGQRGVIREQIRGGKLDRELTRRRMVVTPEELVVTTKHRTDALRWSSVLGVVGTGVPQEKWTPS